MAGGTKHSPDLEFLRRFARDQLLNILESDDVQQDLVIDQVLMKPLDRIAGATFLKEHGVDKIFKLERQKPDACCASQIYIVRPNMEQVKYISDHINAEKAIQKKRKYKIIFVPKKFSLCEMILEQEGVFGDVSLDELTIDFIPMDFDLISMEIPDFFRDYFLEGDQHWLNTIAHAIMTLQTLFGTIPNVFGIGRCAKLVGNMVNIMIDEKGTFTPNDGPEIDTMVLIDRDVDYVTPLCSQVTYEGLIDDIFQIRTGFVQFDPSVTGTDKNVTVLLNSNDLIYGEIRDRHFTNVSGYLSLKAKELQTGYDKRKELSTVGEMKEFVSTQLGNLKQQHKSLATHIGACEAISKLKKQERFENQLRAEHDILEGVDDRETINYIEELILEQPPFHKSLQLMCLLSVVHNGLETKLLKSLRQQFLQTYGHPKLVDLFNLKKLGIFVENDKKNTFRSLAKKLFLIPKAGETIDLKSPNDMSYVFGGSYSPLSCKLVEQICIRRGFQGLEEVTKLFDETFMKQRGVSSRVAQNKKKVVLVFFLGGCTCTEITALRFLAKQKGWKIIIGTTSIINSKRLLESVTDS